jgi:exosortase
MMAVAARMGERHASRLVGIAAALSLGLLLWAYWPTLITMGSKWWTDPQYSQGFLIPLIAGLLLYLRRVALRAAVGQPDPRGFVLLALGLGLHVLSGRLYVDSIDGLSLLPALAGLIWLAGGLELLLVAWPAVAFLAFMVPLPFTLEANVSLPLQRLATKGSTFLLQTLGFPALAEGNIIILSNSRIGVVDACSGLSMLLVVVALAVAFAIIVRPPWLDRIVLIASALPLAVFVNILRITATGIVQETMGTQGPEEIAHEWAGWLMMPAACGLFILEIWLLRVLFPLAASERDGSGFVWREATPKSRAPVTPLGVERMQTKALVLAGILLAAAGAWHGFLSDRWGESSKLLEARGRLRRVSTRLGDWTAEPLLVDARALRLAEVNGYISRMYTHAITREQVSILLICGRPGPISVHTPDVCYEGAGYRMGLRREVTFDKMLPEPSEFWSAYFYKGRNPEPLHILWGWKDGPGWRAPGSPRLTFLGSEALYKLYVLRQMDTTPPAATDETVNRFLELLLPELERSLGNGE